MRRKKSLQVYAKFSPNGLARSIRILKHLGVYANFSPNRLARSTRRMKGLRVHAKLSPSARYGFESWRTLCSKFTRSDGTQLSVIAASALCRTASHGELSWFVPMLRHSRRVHYSSFPFESLRRSRK